MGCNSGSVEVFECITISDKFELLELKDGTFTELSKPSVDDNITVEEIGNASVTKLLTCTGSWSNEDLVVKPELENSRTVSE